MQFLKIKINRPFTLFTASIFIILIIPILIQDGMFMDGQQYACISKNLAEGRGTFWFPVLSETWWKAGSSFFTEHPPLVFGIQSIFFKIGGESIYIERFYSLLTALFSAYLIHLIWTIIIEKPEFKKHSWLPILLWIIVPITYWSYQNNIHENTMGVFILISVYFSIKAIKSNNILTIYPFLSGLLIFLATLSKGIPGLFPIVVIIVYKISHYKEISFRKTQIISLIIFATVLISYSLIILNENAYKSLTFWFQERLLNRIDSEPTVQNRFFILISLINQLIIPGILVFILLLIFKLKSIRNKINTKNKKYIIFFILIGLSGSLPLILTPVQRVFYLMPAFPFFAIGFSLIIVKGLNEYILSIKKRISLFNFIKILSIFFLIISLSFSFMKIGKISRDKDILKDVSTFGKIIPKNSIISINESLFEQWNLQFYLLRKYNICCDASNKQHTYFLTSKSTDSTAQSNYKKIILNTIHFDLYLSKKE